MDKVELSRQGLLMGGELKSANGKQRHKRENERIANCASRLRTNVKAPQKMNRKNNKFKTTTARL
jgi:hypothetical protein